MKLFFERINHRLKKMTSISKYINIKKKKETLKLIKNLKSLVRLDKKNISSASVLLLKRQQKKK